MIRWETLEASLPALAEQYRSAQPFSHLIVDDFCDPQRLASSLPAITARASGRMKSSGDLIFARRKFVDEAFGEICAPLAALRDELLSQRFANGLSTILGAPVFVDPAFYGGGLHVGGSGSFLDMHTDFNLHPRNNRWRRRLNLLLYLNRDWKSAYGGELALQHLEHSRAEPIKVAPLFNRLVVMETDSHTLHGYAPIAFPEGQYRLSIAAYAYSLEDAAQAAPRSTQWYPDEGGPMKRFAARVTPGLVRALRRLRGRDRKD